MTSQEPWTRWRALCLLAVGAALGVACGVGSVLRASQPEGDTVPEGVIALVNGKAIAMEDYARAVAMVASDKRGEITAADRAEVLRRLIDEELLIQYGIEIGLVESHRAVRQAIAQAMLAAIVSEHASERPSEEALRAFYDKNRSLFVRPLRGGSTRMSTETEEGPLPFDEVRTQVEEAYLQHTRDEALREYLTWLRSEAEIVLRLEASPDAGERADQSYESE